MNINILIVGVGGQGTLLASRILGKYAEAKNSNCKLSEIHGMAQRGGSVVTHVRIGEQVFSPIIAEGDADYIIAFEELEALRAKHFLKKEGEMLINTQRIIPMPVITGAQKYPQEIIDRIKAENIKVTAINALEIAVECGNAKAVNSVMLGKLFKRLGLTKEEISELIKAVVPAKFIDENISAAEKGYDYEE